MRDPSAVKEWASQAGIHRPRPWEQKMLKVKKLESEFVLGEEEHSAQHRE